MSKDKMYLSGAMAALILGGSVGVALAQSSQKSMTQRVAQHSAATVASKERAALAVGQAAAGRRAMRSAGGGRDAGGLQRGRAVALARPHGAEGQHGRLILRLQEDGSVSLVKLSVLPGPAPAAGGPLQYTIRVGRRSIEGRMEDPLTLRSFSAPGSVEGDPDHGHRLVKAREGLAVVNVPMEALDELRDAQAEIRVTDGGAQGSVRYQGHLFAK